MSEENKNIFETLFNINVNEHKEDKNGFSYLSWSWAWAEFKKVYPQARYEIKKFNDFPYIHDESAGYMVFTTITVDDLTYEMWLPVMDFRNNAIKNPSMTDINKTIMRCLVKNMAMFGLGLYIYAGEDLPQSEADSVTDTPIAISKEPTRECTPEERVELLKQINRTGINPKRILVTYGKETIDALDYADFCDAMAKLKNAPDGSLADKKGK